MSKPSRRLSRRTRKSRAPLEPQHHMRRLIVLVEAGTRAQRELLAAQQSGDKDRITDAQAAADRAHEALTGYRSRGHGWELIPPQHNARAMRSKYKPHQGKRECARRVRQGLAEAPGQGQLRAAA